MLDKMTKKILVMKVQKELRFLDDIRLPEQLKVYVDVEYDKIGNTSFELESIDRKIIATKAIDLLSDKYDELDENDNFKVIIRNKNEDEEGAYIELKYCGTGKQLMDMMKNR